MKFWADQKNWFWRFPSVTAPFLPDLGFWIYALVLSQYRKRRVQQLPERRAWLFLQLKRWLWTSVAVTERPLYLELRQPLSEKGLGKLRFCGLSASCPWSQRRGQCPSLLSQRKMPLRNSDLCFTGGFVHAELLKFFATNNRGKGFQTATQVLSLYFLCHQPTTDPS